MTEDLVFDHEARKYLASGIHKLTEHAIKSGGNFDLELDNQYENMGASIGKELARKMREECGDGIKTSLLLLNEMVSNTQNHPSILKGMEKTVKALVAQLESMAIPIHSPKEATENSLIANALEQVDTIFVEKGDETSCEFVEGVELNEGYASAKFCTDREKMVCELENPKVITLDKPATSWHEIIPSLSGNQNLLLIASDFKGDALSTLIINHLTQIVNVCAVKASDLPPLPKNPVKAVISKNKTLIITDKKAKTGGIARIRVPEKDMLAMKKSYHLAKAALDEGFVDGKAYIRGAEIVEKSLQLKKDEETGKQIVLQACHASSSSIREPLKVLKNALLLAFDAAHSVLSSECLIGIDGKREV